MNIQYPKDEIVWISYFSTEQELQYIITSKFARNVYFIYKPDNGKLKKLGKANSPIELEEKFIKSK